MKKKADINQLDIFAGTEFAPQVIIAQKKIEERKTRIYAGGTPADSKDMVLWFAQNCKQSLAFLDCVLNGTLPGDYHGSKLWIRRFGNTWTNEIIEDARYWIERGWKVIESKETVCITLYQEI